MNILFVNGIFPQPSQTFVLDQIRFAMSMGHNISVFCHNYNYHFLDCNPDFKPLNTFIIYDKPRRLLNNIRLGIASLCNARRFNLFIKNRKQRQISFPEYSCAVQTRRSPDVIIANFGPNGIAAARIKQVFFPTARLAVIFHGFDVSSYIKKHGWVPYCNVSAMIDVAITVNQCWADLLRKNTSMSQIVVNHLGVDIERIPAWQGHSTGMFTILFIGRMVEKKGLRFLLLAIQELKSRGKACILHIVGNGPQAEEMTALVNRLGINSDVVLHGAQPHDFVLQLMTTCDCLVLPSVTAADGDQEGIPVSLMEAMACGLTVVSTFHSGIPELVTHGMTGLLVPERDVPSLLEAIESLINNPDLRSRLATNARTFVKKYFNSEVQNKVLFDNILHGPAPKGANICEDTLNGPGHFI